MNPRIRIVGVVLLACFVLLFVQLNNIQVRESSALSKNPLAETGKVSSIYLPRGAILSANDEILAYSKKVHGVERRFYPAATAVDFGQLTGYVDTVQDAVDYGIEAEYNSYLSQHETPASSLGQLLTQHEGTDDVVLTVPTSLQEDAASILSGHRGAEIVALDPRDGDILAMYGNPSYDPNALASLDLKEVKQAYKDLSRAYPEPFITTPSAVPHPPGSTFKVIDTTAVLDHDPSLALEDWPYVSEITLPDSSSPFHNYAYETCGGVLSQILAVSCDTAFAQVGLALGAHRVVSEAESFGWCEGSAGVCARGGSRPPLDLPASEVSGASIAPESELAANPPYLAYSAIGQYEDDASALSMALVAAGIADNGKIMAPHLMSKIIGADGNVVVRYKPHVWKHPTSAATAAKVRELMLGVTEDSDGTAAGVFTNLLDEGIQVAAKTGTAEAVNSSSILDCATDDWLIAMAPAGPGQVPKAVVAAEVPTPNGSYACDEATGATVAGPLVDQMLTDVLAAGR